MITLTLNTRNMKPRMFRADIRMRECLDAYGLADRWQKAMGEYTQEQIEEAIDFIVRCFGRQFTADELLDGYDGNPFQLIGQMLLEVVQYTQEGMANFPPRAEPTKARV